MHPGAKALRDALPDVPRWLKIRALLARPGSDLYVSPEGFVVSLRSAKRAAAVGKPEAHLFEAALEHVDPGWHVLVAPEDAEHVEPFLSGFTRQRAILHVLSGATPRLEQPDPDVIELTPHDLDRVPEWLAQQLSRVIADTRIVAVQVAGVIASVAYPAWQTERLYDIAVATLGPHRRKGYGERAVRALFDQRDEVQRPVWSASEDNLTSLRLAARLGFRPFDELVVFTPELSRAPTN
jgi:RimJ/RimL family protein N-acetyltransferase